MHLQHFFFWQTVNSTKIEIFCLPLQPLLDSLLERFIVRIVDTTKARLQIAKQKIVTKSQVRTVCRVVELYAATVANNLLCNHGLVDWSVVMQQPDSLLQHPSTFLLDGIMQLQQQTGVVLSIHCSIGRQVVS